MDVCFKGRIFFCLLKVLIGVYGLHPTLDFPAINVTVLEGETAKLPCSMYNIGDYKVKWLDHSLRVLTVNVRRISENERYFVERPTNEEWNLRILNVTYSDVGQYQCRVNNVPATSKIVNLVVQVPAKIRQDISSKNTTLKERDTLVLKCYVNGFPQPKVNWYKLKSGRKQDINRSGEELIIPNVKKLNAGTYQCEAYNGVYDNMNISVVVEFAPTVTLHSKEIGQNVGKDVILECMIHANPHSEMYWLKGGIIIDTLNKDKYRITSYRSDTGEYRITLSLMIINTQKDDFGNYTCLARNSIGQDFDSCVLYDYVMRFTTTKAPVPTMYYVMRSTTTKALVPTRSGLHTKHSTIKGLSSGVSHGIHYRVTLSVLFSLATIVVISF